MADWYGVPFLRLLLVEDLFNDCAIFSADPDLKIAGSRSNALLFLVTEADHLFLAGAFFFAAFFLAVFFVAVFLLALADFVAIKKFFILPENEQKSCLAGMLIANRIGKSGMKKYLCFLFAITVSAFQKSWNGQVKGSVNPPDAAVRAWLFGIDTVNTPVDKGLFEFQNIRPGHYGLMLEARPPYRNAIKDGITVSDGQLTDAGVIDMQQ